VPDAELGEGAAEYDGVGVGGRVIGHHGPDVDAVGGEERVRPRVEAGAGRPGLVGEDLGVGEPGVDVHDRVDHVVAAGAPVCPAVRPARLVPQRPSATTPGDPPELLHVQVHELAGGGAFVAAHDTAGGPVH
jgi:hypothetical protein